MARFGILSKVLTDKGSQFASKFFAALCKELNVKMVATVEYQPQADRLVESFISTLISRLRHCVAEYQQDRDTFAFLLTLASYIDVYRTIRLPSFSLETTRLSVGPIGIACTMPPDVGEVDSPLAYIVSPVHRAALLEKLVDTSVKKSQECTR